jgi:hypothetical protein
VQPGSRRGLLCGQAEQVRGVQRELIKLAAFTAAVAGALRDRGIPEPAASLAAETGTAVFKVAFARWVGQPGQPDLPGIFAELMDELGDVLAGRAPASPPDGW